MAVDESKHPITIFNEPMKQWAFPDFRELWRFRYLLYQLIIRELQSRYKQTILGLLWTVINPLITMVVFTFVFRRIADVPSYDIPYPIFSYSGLVAWTLFSKGMAASSTSIVSNAMIIGKAYFPAILAPASKLFTGIVDFALAFVVLLVMMLLYGYLPTWRIIAIPLLILLTLSTSLGIGLWLSAMHVRFRDVAHLVPFMVQTLMYISPVAYPSSLLQEPWRTLYGINPVVTVCDGFRWALLGLDTLHAGSAIMSILVSSILLVTGLVFFHRMEHSFPDLI